VNFLADENLEMQVVERLRQDGHHVLAVVEVKSLFPDFLPSPRAKCSNNSR